MCVYTYVSVSPSLVLVVKCKQSEDRGGFMHSGSYLCKSVYLTILWAIQNLAASFQFLIFCTNPCPTHDQPKLVHRNKSVTIMNKLPNCLINGCLTGLFTFEYRYSQTMILFKLILTCLYCCFFVEEEVCQPIPDFMYCYLGWI